MGDTRQFEEAEPGLFLVVYEAPDDLSPELQAPLVKSLEQAAAKGPTGICFHVGSAVTSVKLEVPAFWLEVTSRSELNLRAMAIASRSVGVQLAAKGFALSNRIRKIPIEVKTFPEMEEARRWVKTTLSA